MAESKFEAPLPLVSVIIPAFNAEQYIHDAINSVLSQSWQEFEIIVINDGSIDGTLEMLESLKAKEPRLKIVSQKNSGSARARNVGLELAMGDYIAFLDADDVWPAYKLELQLTFLAQNPNFDICCGIDEHFDNPSARLNPAKRKTNFHDIKLKPEFSGWIFTALFAHTFVHINNLLLKSHIANAYKFDENLRQGQDTHFWLQLAQQHPIAYIDETLSYYRLHPSSITASRFNKTNPRIEVIEAFTQRYGLCDDEGNCLSKAAMRQALFIAYHNHGNKLAKDGHKKVARYNYLMAIKYNLWNLGTYKNYLKTFLV